MPETYKSKLRISVSPVFRLGADESTDGIGYTDAHIVAQGTGQYAHEQTDVDKGLPLGAGGDEGGGGAIRDTAHDGQQHILKTDFQQPGDEQVQQNGTGDDTEAEQGDVEGGSEELLQVHRKADGHQEQHRYEKAQVKVAAQLADGRHLCQDDGEGGDEQDAACTAEPCSEYHRGDAGGSPHGAKADGQQPGDFLDGPFLGGHQFLVVAIPQQLRLAHIIGPQLFQPFGTLVQGGGSKHQDQRGDAHHIVGGIGRGDGVLAGIQAYSDGGQVGTAAGVGAHEHTGHLPAHS